MSRPGTVPSKPVLGVNLPSKHKLRPKTSDSKSDKSSPQEPDDPDKISEDKITAELHQITKHDKNLLKKLSSMKDLDALVSTNPLQLVVSKQNVEVIGEPLGDVRFNDNRSLWSERRSVMTSFTGGNIILPEIWDWDCAFIFLSHLKFLEDYFSFNDYRTSLTICSSPQARQGLRV